MIIRGLMRIFSVLSNARVVFTLWCLFIIKLLTNISLPGIDAELIAAVYERNKEVLSFFNSLTGGSIERLAISSLHLAPYIQASIMMTVLSKVFEPFKSLKKDSYKRNELNKYQRMLTLIFAIAQSIGIVYTAQKFAFSAIIDSDLSFKFFSVLILTCTSIGIMWLAERITVAGIGGGTSIVVFSNIISTVGSWVYKNFIDLVYSGELFYMIWIGGIFVVFIVFCEGTMYLVPLFFKRSFVIDEEKKQCNAFPLKISPAGILPAMFAENLMTLIVAPLSFVVQLFGGSSDFISNKYNFLMIKGVLIVLLYTLCLNFAVEPESVAHDMQMRQTYFNKIREGERTVDYMSHLLTLIGILGVIYSLCVLILPDLIGLSLNISGLRGTSMIILVLTGIEIYDRIPRFVQKT